MGLFIAFMPIPGHMIVAIMAALLLRVNIPVAAMAVWVTNPLTVVPIFYLAYRLGVGSCPTGRDIVDELGTVVGHVLRWKKRLRFVGGENCPETGPAVFAGNHLKMLDAALAWQVIYTVTHKTLSCHFMMRDDVFEAGLAKNRLFDLDEILMAVGAFPISRGDVRLTQLKPFINLLRDGESFTMYPNGTRSRSGMFMEYRDVRDEPGGVSFFLAHGQRGDTRVQVPAVPVTHTYNPATKVSVIAIGERQYLPPDADRTTQREFDLHLVEVMAELVEVHVPHVLSGILYLRCLHNQAGPLEKTWLETAVRNVIDATPNRLVDPNVRENLPREMRRTLKYLRSHSMIFTTRHTVIPNPETILAAPPIDKHYQKLNPVKYLTNQIIHLPDLCRAIERVARD